VSMRITGVDPQTTVIVSAIARSSAAHDGTALEAHCNVSRKSVLSRSMRMPGCDAGTVVRRGSDLANSTGTNCRPGTRGAGAGIAAPMRLRFCPASHLRTTFGFRPRPMAMAATDAPGCWHEPRTCVLNSAL
jgi:hypothetical protein